MASKTAAAYTHLNRMEIKILNKIRAVIICETFVNAHSARRMPEDGEKGRLSRASRVPLVDVVICVMPIFSFVFFANAHFVKQSIMLNTVSSERKNSIRNSVFISVLYHLNKIVGTSRQPRHRTEPKSKWNGMRRFFFFFILRRRGANKRTSVFPAGIVVNWL